MIVHKTDRYLCSKYGTLHIFRGLPTPVMPIFHCNNFLNSSTKYFTASILFTQTTLAVSVSFLRIYKVAFFVGGEVSFKNDSLSLSAFLYVAMFTTLSIYLQQCLYYRIFSYFYYLSLFFTGFHSYLLDCMYFCLSVNSLSFLSRILAESFDCNAESFFLIFCPLHVFLKNFNLKKKKQFISSVGFSGLCIVISCLVLSFRLTSFQLKNDQSYLRIRLPSHLFI